MAAGVYECITPRRSPDQLVIDLQLFRSFPKFREIQHQSPKIARVPMQINPLTAATNVPLQRDFDRHEAAVTPPTRIIANATGPETQRKSLRSQQSDRSTHLGRIYKQVTVAVSASRG
tara:strand:+ start:863 stop:1216 length:354 start_codon:yes stop_codon:yes gene_type:complete